jgi:hypothetical protein
LEPNDDSKKEVPLPMLNIGFYLFKSLLLVHQFVLITPVLKVHPGGEEIAELLELTLFYTVKCRIIPVE